MARIAQLGGISEEPGRLTRRCLTPALQEAMTLVAGWMQAAGMTIRRDTVGNLIGRYEAAQTPARTLLLGSHLDTVRDAGAFDGPLGVMLALAAVEDLHARGVRLPFAVEVLAFADEEGLRFGTAYLGSKVFAGTFDPAYLDLRDADGITLAEAIRAAGGDPAQIPADARAAADLIGYCEWHIEQGPVLEAHDLPVGVVTAISGQTRVALTFTGQAGHAGTVPMAGRRDALMAAAEFVLAVESYAHAHAGIVATVGKLAVEPGAGNVIPGRATLSLDVRHAEDPQRVTACTAIEATARTIAERRGLAFTWTVLQDTPAVACSPDLASLVAEGIAGEGLAVWRLPSGAGHDAVILSTLTPVAMGFVRCREGISHNPSESATAADVAMALAALQRFLLLLAEAEGRR
jgi:allantoate deiminase